MSGKCFVHWLVAFTVSSAIIAVLIGIDGLRRFGSSEGLILLRRLAAFGAAVALAGMVATSCCGLGRRQL